MQSKLNHNLKTFHGDEQTNPANATTYYDSANGMTDFSKFLNLVESQRI